MTTKRERQEEIYQDLLAQSQGKNVIGTTEATLIAGISWSTLNRDMKSRKPNFSQSKIHSKRSILLRDLAKYIDGDFDF